MPRTATRRGEPTLCVRHKKEQVFVVNASQEDLAADDASITRLHGELDRLVKEQEETFFTLQEADGDHNARLRAEIRLLEERLDLVKATLDTLESAGGQAFDPQPADWDELALYFPQLNRQRLEQVQRFHRAIRTNLATQAAEEITKLTSLRDALTHQIRTLSSQMIRRGSAPHLDRRLMDAYGDVKVQIQELEIANKQCEMRGKLDQARDDARANLDAINDELCPMLERDINQELERLATLLKEPVAPRLSFEPGPAYTYGVPGDDGTGTNHLALAMFDHSVLALTPLPFFIHDTPVHAGVSKERLSRLVHLAAAETKQTFLALDNQTFLHGDAQGVVRQRAVINLDKGPDSLFGYLTDLSTDAQRPTFGFNADDLPKPPPAKRKTKVDHNQTELFPMD